MRNLEAIKENIKALLSKTVANGCTEAEMFAALAKAQALMDAYEITDGDIREARDEAATKHTEAPGTDDPHSIKWYLSYGVGKFCNVQFFRSRADGNVLACIGSKSDADWALWLLDTLGDHVFDELYKHLVTDLSPPAERRTVKRVFVEACCGRIGERLVELVEQSASARTSNGKELVLVKDAAIAAYMKDNNIHLRMRACGGGPRNHNEAAHAAGREAGNRASFGRPVSGAPGVLRIGKGAMTDRSWDDMMADVEKEWRAKTDAEKIAGLRREAERLRAMVPEYPVFACFTASELADMCEDHANRIEAGDLDDDDEEKS